MPLAKLMPTRRMTRFLLIALAASGLCGQSVKDQTVTEFMGRKVTIVEPELDDQQGGIFPKGPASICLEGPPKRQCFTFPEDFGLGPTATLMELKKGVSALLFSAASGGVSGRSIRYAILRPGTGNDLEDLFWSGVTVNNQSEHALWTDPSVSSAPIFVTADYVGGAGEAHYGDHRFTISGYVLEETLRPFSDFTGYALEDRYMTARWYDLGDDKVDILNSEKPEIFARLKRVKAAAERQWQQPR